MIHLQLDRNTEIVSFEFQDAHLYFGANTERIKGVSYVTEIGSSLICKISVKLLLYFFWMQIAFKSKIYILSDF